jgi:hypothetical protein
VAVLGANFLSGGFRYNLFIHEILLRNSVILEPKIGSWDSRKTAIKSVGGLNQVPDFVRQQVHSRDLSSNEIKARAKLPSMPFPYLVTLLILLPFVLFRKHSGLVRHYLCSAHRQVKCRVRKCAGRWAFLHRKSRLRHSLIPKFLPLEKLGESLLMYCNFVILFISFQQYKIKKKLM